MLRRGNLYHWLNGCCLHYEWRHLVSVWPVHSRRSTAHGPVPPQSWWYWGPSVVWRSPLSGWSFSEPHTHPCTVHSAPAAGSASLSEKNRHIFTLRVALKAGSWCRPKHDFLMYCSLQWWHIVLTISVLGSSGVLTEWCVSLPRLWQPFVLLHHAKLAGHHKACLYLRWDLVQEIGQVYLPQHVPMCFLPLA